MPATYPTASAAHSTLALLCVAYILAMLDRQILSLLVGPIRAAFGISDFQFSLLQGAAFALFYTVAGLPLGWLADRYCRKRIIAASIFVWSSMTMAFGLSKNFTQLFVTRAGVGAGEAGLTPAAYSLISDSYPPNKLPFALAIYKASIPIGGGLSLILGGVLYEYYAAHPDFSWPVFGHLEPWQSTMISIGLPGLMVSLMVLTIQDPGRKGMMSGSSGTQSGTRISDVILFLWERRRCYGPIFLGSSFLGIASYGSAAWYPELMVRHYGVSKSEIGTAFGLIVCVFSSLGIVLGPRFSSILANRGYTDSHIRCVLIVTCLSVVPATAAPLLGSYYLTLFVLIPTTFIGTMYLGLVAATIQLCTPNEMRGQTTALYIFFSNIIGLAIGSSVLAAFTDFVFDNDQAIDLSIASLHIIFLPTAALLFWYGLPGVRNSLRESQKWNT